MKSPIFGIFLIAFAAPLGAAPATRPMSDDDIAVQIHRLSDPDAKTREMVTRALIAKGNQVRDQIVAATRSDDPELRARAGYIILQLPWYRRGDPPQAMQILTYYGQLDEAQRSRVVSSYVEMPLPRAILLRLVREDPSDVVRWTIVSTISEMPDSTEGADLRQLVATADDPPILTLAGLGWLNLKRDRGIELLERAIAADALRPQSDHGVLDVAFDQLAIAAVEDGQLERAVEILQRESARQVYSAAPSSAAAKLFAMRLHLAYPPSAAANPQIKPTPLEIIRRIYAQAALALPAPSRIALTRSSTLTQHQHYAAGTFLAACNHLEAAEIELRAVVTNRPNASLDDVNALIALSKLSGARGDDLAVANDLSRLMQIVNELRLSLKGREEDVLTEIHYRYLRIAHANNDAAAIALHVAELKRLAPANANAALEAIDTLRKFKHDEEAAALFKRTYEKAKAAMIAAPANIILKNDLAWLCARAGERLPEALELATAAVKESPQTSAFLDTAAEANFRLGKIDEAIKLETRALELTPNSKFMKEQLERFQKGKH